jgi:quercetin dioxygenase-like cupin family protein
MEATFRFVSNLAEELDIPKSGTLSVPIYEDPSTKVVLFGFAAGQELSEHTSSMPASLYQVSGKAQWVLGGDSMDADAGSWAHMNAHLPHAIRAIEPCIMLLILNRAGKTSAAPE